MNVLMIDEDRQSLNLLTHAVSEFDKNAYLYPATDIKTGLDYSDCNGVDVVFLEINMRCMDGICAAKEIMKKHPKANIIFCTDSRDHAMEAWSMNCSGYILKPLNDEKIRRAMSNLRYKIEQGEN